MLINILKDIFINKSVLSKYKYILKDCTYDTDQYSHKFKIILYDNKEITGKFVFNLPQGVGELYDCPFIYISKINNCIIENSDEYIILLNKIISQRLFKRDKELWEYLKLCS